MKKWTFEDAANGLCDVDVIGQIRPPAEPPPAPAEPPVPPPPAEPPKPLTRLERKAKLQAITDAVLEMAHANPAALLDDNASTINKLIDLAAKLDDKEDALPSSYLERIASTVKGIRGFTTSDLYSALVEAVGEDFVISERRHEFQAFILDKLLAKQAKINERLCR